MAKKVLLKNSDGTTVMPITRGELIVDSSGNQALHSSQFLATDSQPGLMSKEDKIHLEYLKNSLEYTPTSVSLTTNWSASGFILSGVNGFTSGVYAIKIMSGSLMFSGIVSVYVGKITTEDEIVLHMSGIPQTYTDGTQGRIYAKIAPSQTADYGEIYLATSVPQSAITNLSITMKKLL